MKPNKKECYKPVLSHQAGWVSGVFATSALMTSCGGLSGDAWQYSTETDPVTKSLKHSATRIVDAKGSSSGDALLVVSVDCLNEKDPESLYVGFLAFNGDTKEESGLALTSDINIRFNGAAIGPIGHTGSAFSNEARYQLTRLNFISIVDAFQNSSSESSPLGVLSLVRMFPNASVVEKFAAYDQFKNTLRAFGGQALREQMGDFFRLQRTIWSSEFVFSVSTSDGVISHSFSLNQPEVKRVVEACGFTYRDGPPESKSVAGRGATSNAAPIVAPAAERSIPDAIPASDAAVAPEGAAVAPQDFAAASEDAAVAADDAAVPAD
jgi:hypothetical protein